MPRQLPLAAVATLPGTYLGGTAYVGLPGPTLGPYAGTFVFGAAVVGAAFLLVWAAEAARVDISAGLAIAILALLAVLPEYAVDFVFSFRAGREFAESGSCQAPVGGEGSDPCSLALANMTGANRILVGVGWPLIVFVATAAALRHRREAEESVSVVKPGVVRLRPPRATEVAFLGIATLYSLTLPLKSSLTVFDFAILAGIFGAYAWRLAQAPATRPELIGAAAWIGEKDRGARRTTVVSLFAFAGLVVLANAEHFADALVGTGQQLGVGEFALVQWLAPIASESPEFIVASIYAWRLQASESLGTLISSKVNQWTLLVGTIPLVFFVASVGSLGFPLDGNQRVELLLTAAQSLFAVALLVDVRLGVRGAGALLGLFAVQFAASLTVGAGANRWISLVLSAVYLTSAVVMLLRSSRRAYELAKNGMVTPFDVLMEQDERLEHEVERAAAVSGR